MLLRIHWISIFLFFSLFDFIFGMEYLTTMTKKNISITNLIADGGVFETHTQTTILGFHPWPS